jgi:membrane protein required for colicin V production
LTGADVLILVVVLASTIYGLVRGFVREAVSLVFWIVAIWAAWKFGPLVEPHLGGLLADPAVAPWVGRLVVMIVVLIVGMIVGMLLGHFTTGVGLGPLDRVLGLLFGLVRGTLLVGLMVIGAELLHLNHEPWWTQVDADAVRRDSAATSATCAVSSAWSAPAPSISASTMR